MVSPSPVAQTVVAVGADLQRLHLGGHRQVRAELLGLHHGPVGELAAGDPGREPEVVLDPRRRRGLPPGGHTVEKDRREALRGAVDGRGQPGGPGADHGQVEHVDRDVPGAEAGERGQLGRVGVAQHPVAPDHDRRLRRGDAQLAQQALRRGVGLHVDEPVRQPVAAGELAEPVGVGGEPGPDDPEPGPLRDHQRPAQQVGAQDLVAERRVVDAVVAEAVGGDDEQLGRLGRHVGHEGHLPGEQAEIAQEPPRPVHPQHPLLEAAERLHHRDPPGQHDTERVVGGALGDQDLAGDVGDRCGELMSRATLGESSSTRNSDAT